MSSLEKADSPAPDLIEIPALAAQPDIPDLREVDRGAAVSSLRGEERPGKRSVWGQGAAGIEGDEKNLGSELTPTSNVTSAPESMSQSDSTNTDTEGSSSPLPVGMETRHPLGAETHPGPDQTDLLPNSVPSNSSQEAQTFTDGNEEIAPPLTEPSKENVTTPARYSGTVSENTITPFESPEVTDGSFKRRTTEEDQTPLGLAGSPEQETPDQSVESQAPAPPIEEKEDKETRQEESSAPKPNRHRSSQYLREGAERESEMRIAGRTLQERAWMPGDRAPWDPKDALLDTGDNSFESWFAGTLPEGRGLREYIESTLEPVTPRIGLEIGGIGSGLFSGFSRDFFEETAGVNLTDLRENSMYGEAQMAHDKARNHRVIPGNILDPATKQDVTRWLDGRRVNLLIERMYAGITTLPRQPFLMGQQAQFWYGLLAEEGVMFAQVPPAFTRYVNTWENEVKARHPSLDVQVEDFKGTKLLRLRKLPGAPDTLPLLEARAVMQEEREGYKFRWRVS